MYRAPGKGAQKDIHRYYHHHHHHHHRHHRHQIIIINIIIINVTQPQAGPGKSFSSTGYCVATYSFGERLIHKKISNS